MNVTNIDVGQVEIRGGILPTLDFGSMRLVK